jgi:hypothetical protein
VSTRVKATKRKSQKVETPVDMKMTLEYDGITYQKGDPIWIRGESGNFVFLWADTGKDGKVVVNTWWRKGVKDGGYAQFRSFYLEKVGLPKTKAPRQTKFLYCDDHPTYGAVRRPRTSCNACWDAYRLTHPDIEDKAPKKVKKTKPAGKVSGLTMEMIEDE